MSTVGLVLVLIACGVVPSLVVGLVGRWWHVRQMHAAYMDALRRHELFSQRLDRTIVPRGFLDGDHSAAVSSPELRAAIERAAERRRKR